MSERGEELFEPFNTVGWQLDGLLHSVKKPAKDNFACAKVGITLQEFLHGRDMLASWRVLAVQGTEHSINSMQQLAEMTQPGLLIALHCLQKIINKDVGMLNRPAKWSQDRWWPCAPLVGTGCMRSGLCRGQLGGALSLTRRCPCWRIWGTAGASFGCLWRWSVGNHFQRVRHWLHRVGPVVGNVCDSFSGSTKPGWRLSPAHWKHQGEGNELVFLGIAWKSHSQLGDGTVIELESIEAICQVNFGNVDRAKAGIGVTDKIEDAFQGTTKLHGLSWCQLDCVVVDTIEGKIHNQSGSSVSLWYHPHG